MSNSAKKVVETTDLGKRFGDFWALKSLSMQVEKGDIFAFLGPNGAGKTTTIKMLMGILQPTAGSAKINGMDCFRDRVAVKRFIGYLPDDPVFYDYLKGIEIIRFVGEMFGMTQGQIRERAEPLIGDFDLEDALSDYAVNYSRGMKKKLGIVCCLLHDPDLLILDEPTNGLDPYGSRVLHRLIREKAARGKSVFFSTHLLDQAERLCNHVAILHKGKMVASGQIDALRQDLALDVRLEEVFFAVTSQGEGKARTGENAGQGEETADAE